jgi:hypothetical protein
VLEIEQLRELKPGSLVFAWPGALARDVCAEMLRRFEAHPEQQQPGRMGQDGALQTSIKHSTDLNITGRENWRDLETILRESLARGLGMLARRFPFFAVNPFEDSGYNLQRTAPGEYYHWHVDGGPGEEFSQRQLVAIWYLNQVSGGGGETEFELQDLRVRPEAGTLLLFPPFWTHIHRGVTPVRDVKYIATTWVRFRTGHGETDAG